MAPSAQIPCGHCGTFNNSTDQFCANCGYTLSGGSTSTIPALANTPTVVAPHARRATGALGQGVVLGGRYRIIQLVGKGGFGAVYQASDERFKSRPIVAVKEMSDAQLSASERVKALDNFSQEADLLVQLSHPNLPKVNDFLEDGGKVYLVMAFIDGKSLEKVQDEVGGPLDERQVMGWALQLCDVLYYLHTQPQPIIFRDMKPSNVMVTKNGQIKLIDFGIARFFKKTSSRDTTTLGSPGYAPLEQYGTGQSDERSDIYALGATLYDMLTHELPADAPVRQVNPSVFVNPRQLNPRISPQTEAIILRAMERDPKDRYQTALEMYQAVLATGLASITPSSFAATNPGMATVPTNAATQLAPFVPAAPGPGLPVLSAIPTQVQQNPATPPLVLPGASGQAGGASAQTVAAHPAPVAMVQQQMQATSFSPVNPPTSLPPPYMPVPPIQSVPGQRGISRRALLAGGLAAAGVLAGGGYLASHFLLSGSNAGSAGTIHLDFVYSTEKDAWFQVALAAFNNSPDAVYAPSNKSIQVTLNDSGSLDIADKIVSRVLQPVAWSPASDVEMTRLDYAWKQKNGQSSEIIASSSDLSPQSLVSSPLVFAVWGDRATAFLQKYADFTWNAVHTAIQSGWAGAGHPEWGRFVLGQTYPDRSNSGLVSLILIASAYAQKHNGPQTLGPDYINNTSALWDYIEVFEKAVGQYGQSSQTYLAETVIPAQPPYSLTMTYENLTLYYQPQAAQARNIPLQIYYPDLNAISNHPFIILQAPWVSSEQQMAAKQFRDFLLRREQQTQALKYGFRPVDTSILLTDAHIANNPFKQLSTLAQRTFDVATAITLPLGDTVDALIAQWQKHNPGV